MGHAASMDSLITKACATIFLTVFWTASAVGGFSVQDEEIEVRAIERLASQRILSRGRDIAVTSYNGFVLVTGTVAEEADKLLATRLLTELRFVRRIYNKINVGSRETLRDDDLLLLRQAKNAVSSGNEVIPAVHNGIVYLLGIVTEEQGFAEAVAVAELPLARKVVQCFEEVPTDSQARATRNRLTRELNKSSQKWTNFVLEQERERKRILEAAQAERERKRALEQKSLLQTTFEAFASNLRELIQSHLATLDFYDAGVLEAYAAFKGTI